jgi:hypothetical protein
MHNFRRKRSHPNDPDVTKRVEMNNSYESFVDTLAYG